MAVLALHYRGINKGMALDRRIDSSTDLSKKHGFDLQETSLACDAEHMNFESRANQILPSNSSNLQLGHHDYGSTYSMNHPLK
jgi:hypothetical protein